MFDTGCNVHFLLIPSHKFFLTNKESYHMSYAYWTVHHLDI